MNKNRKGFTLIELLVVVLIIGILASIAIPQYFKVVEKARVSEAMSIISSVKSAEERFLARGGSYTQDFTQLDISYAGMTATNLSSKFYSASASAGTCTSGPCYVLTLTRHTNASTVAARYGNYSLNVNVPEKPQVTIAACPGGGANCNELID
ncbi:MAG: prepilin-type N-terminal cleavage/methylation domain-containing protein [Elusimicrobia bacterium]|jgi:prepilin-type N-terminal cleavage/methylation domain-containing protein|nr:prepilin-type N-terminal cleavage/methylation domain-containing protein [Elusimicrobiota bacterium]